MLKFKIPIYIVTYFLQLQNGYLFSPFLIIFFILFVITLYMYIIYSIILNILLDTK